MKGYLNNKNTVIIEIIKENQLCFENHESEYVNEILAVRKSMQEIDEEIIYMKREESNAFKRKNESIKTNVKFIVQHDLIHAALFGNNISI